MTFVLTATKVWNILSKTLKDAVSGFFEFHSLCEGGGLSKKQVSNFLLPIVLVKVFGETAFAGLFV